MTTSQLALLIGIPSALIVLAALDSHRRHRRLSRRLDTMSADLIRGYSLERIEQQRQDVINKGAAAGKTISTEAVLKHLLESKTTHEGPVKGGVKPDHWGGVKVDQ